VEPFRRDREGRQGFEEGQPRRQDHIACQGQDMGEEARSLRGGLAGHLPGRLEDIQHRMQLVGGRRALARSVAAEQAVLKMRRPPAWGSDAALTSIVDAGW
jgi:hypothetical protein